jgi:hypothetical protein
LGDIARLFLAFLPEESTDVVDALKPNFEGTIRFLCRAVQASMEESPDGRDNGGVLEEEVVASPGAWAPLVLEWILKVDENQLVVGQEGGRGDGDD